MLKSLFLSLLICLTLSTLPPKENCPDYFSLIDATVTSEFNEELYQGEWYNQFDTEGTEPSVCHCDRMTWLINDDKTTFREFIDTFGGQIGLMKLDLKGYLALNKTSQWLRTEGAAIVGVIPNGVISMLTSSDLPNNKNNYTYQAVMVYSCWENYLF